MSTDWVNLILDIDEATLIRDALQSRFFKRFPADTRADSLIEKINPLIERAQRFADLKAAGHEIDIYGQQHADGLFCRGGCRWEWSDISHERAAQDSFLRAHEGIAS